jgi:hypothetical protein
MIELGVGRDLWNYTMLSACMREKSAMRASELESLAEFKYNFHLKPRLLDGSAAR